MLFGFTTSQIPTEINNNNDAEVVWKNMLLNL